MKNDPIEVSFVILLKGKLSTQIFEFFAIPLAYNYLANTIKVINDT